MSQQETTIMENNQMEVSNIETENTNENKITLAPPRPAWLVFLLMFGSLGIYPIFWIIFRVKEFKLILNKPLMPWLWIFVPVFPLAQLIALPRFVDRLNDIEEKANIPKWNAWHGAWYILVIAATVITNASERYEMPSWIYLPVLIIWSLLFTAIDNRIAKAKKALTQYEYKKIKGPISKIEWLTLLTALPFTLLIIYYLTIPLINTIEKLPTKTPYINLENKFTLSYVDNNWTIVKNGTHSEGDAILELHGPLHDMFFVVFDHTRDSSLDLIAYPRINSIMDELDQANCNQIREFSKDGSSIIVKIYCTGKFMNENVLETVTIIETEKGFLELYGHLSSEPKSYAKYAENFKKMAEGFSPL